MSVVRDPRTRAAGLLDLMVGLRSFASRFDAVIERYAPPGQAAATDGVDPAWLELVLGAIALRTHIEGAMPPERTEPGAEPPARLEDLLR